MDTETLPAADAVDWRDTWCPVPEGLRRRGGLARTLEGAHLSAIANHPTVRPWLGGDDAALDLVATIANPENVAFETALGGFVALALGSGRYDVHSLFLPEGRGGLAAVAMERALDYMFTATDATELRTSTLRDNRAAVGLARQAGFEHRFSSPVPWETGQPRREAAFLALVMERWALRAPRAHALGAWFHAALARVRATPEDAHPADAVHDAIVGAVVLLCQEGNAEKAVRFYNVWAQLARYQTIVLLRRQPIILDLGDAVVEVAPGGMEVLSCR